MGKRKHGYNQDARTNKKVVIDNSIASQIKVDEALLGEDPASYGDDNPFILPSKKRKTTKVKEEAPRKRVLSKKERRQLESVVDRKKKKEKRSEILDALSKVQIPESELKFMVSTQDMHHRKTNKKGNTRKAKIASDEPTSQTVNMIKGANRKSKYAQEPEAGSDSSDCEITSDEEEAPADVEGGNDVQEENPPECSKQQREDQKETALDSTITNTKPQGSCSCTKNLCFLWPPKDFMRTFHKQ